MFYQFPRIETLSDVLPAIEGRSEFIVADRGDHIVVNYVVNMEDTFPSMQVAGGSAKMRAQRQLYNALRRECRGLIFDKASGRIIRRPYHKFFNVNERPETLARCVDLSQPHAILAKLDGSMIVPYRIPGRLGVIWGTKMGDTDVATPVQQFVKMKPQYFALFSACEEIGANPIFEWCSRKQRIVIDYEQDNLILTAIRYLESGEYMPQAEMHEMARRYCVDSVHDFAVAPTEDQIGLPKETDIEHVLDFIRRQEGAEGVVVRWSNGHMVKIKSEWYTLIHKAKDRVTEEKTVVDLIVNDSLDDTLALLLDEDRERLVKYQDRFWTKVNQTVERLGEDVSLRVRRYTDRKQYALEQASDDTDVIKTATFHYFDRSAPTFVELRQFVVDRFIKPNLGTRTKFAAMKQRIFKDVRFY